MRILVAGGHGFIGRHVVQMLCEEGHEVVVLDLQPAPQDLPGSRYHFIAGDFFHSDIARIAIGGGVDALIHMVGLADAQIAEQQPDVSFRLNVYAAHLALEACKAYGVSHIIVPSTAAVYGTSRRSPNAEDQTPDPVSIYAYHKWMVETIAKGYWVSYGISYSVLRLFNVYGKGHRGIIHSCLSSARRGIPAKVFGARQLRDFVYVGDVARAIAQAACVPQARNQVINVGSGQGHPIQDIVELLQEIVPNLKVEYLERPNFRPYDSVADISLARALMGFNPKATLEDIKNVIRKEMIEC